MKLSVLFKTYKKINSILKTDTPVLSQKSLRKIAEEYFDNRDKYLNLLEGHPSPFYIFDKSILINQAKLFREKFTKHIDDAEFYYAMKSNNYSKIAKALVNTGYGLDVSSGLELKIALSLNADKIIFSGPGKTDEELRLAVMNSEKVILLADSINELLRLNKIATEKDRLIRAGIRIRTNNEGLWCKFGILLDDLISEWDKIARLNKVEFQGLQFHSSWNLTPVGQIKIIRDIGEKITDFPESLLNSIKFLDIGGGYWPQHGEWLQYAATPAGKLKDCLGIKSNNEMKHYHLPAAPLSLFAYEIHQALEKHIFQKIRCKIFLEPGRWICNDSMQLLMTVVDKKASNAIITDAGTNAIGWERFESDYFPVLNLSSPALKENPCSIYGSLCTPHDIWGYNYWGNSINAGDVLLIPLQGAYTYSLRQSFIKPVPKVITI